MEDRVDHEWKKREGDLAREKPDECHCWTRDMLAWY